MSPVVRRALVLGSILAVLVSGPVFADTVTPDGDAVAGIQSAVALGDVAPGASVPLDVAFVLTCKGTSHVAGDSTIAVTLAGQTWPEDGVATVSDGTIDVPADWPAPDTGCPDSGLTTSAGTQAHLVLTAPTILGTGHEFVFEFVTVPEDGVSNLIFFTATMNVVESAPKDTTAPVLHGVPADMTVFTGGTSATVSWTDPTATDDTDPDPDVACDPDTGSTFPLGTTTVTCTATDASDNSSSATFTVTVVQLAAGFGRPLEDTVPALIGNLGRTIPLRLTIVVGDAVQGPSDIAAPTLRLDRLDGCTATAASFQTRAGGTFAWNDGVWQLNLATGSLTAGCWRASALSAGSVAASAVIRLTPDQVPAKGSARAPSARGRSAWSDTLPRRGRHART